MSSLPQKMLRVTVVAAAILLVGCATLRVDSFAARGFDVQQYQTYAWGAADGTPTGDPRIDSNTIFEDRLKGQVEKELERRGFAKATTAAPDLLVHYHASFTQEIDVRDLDRDYTYCESSDCGPFVYDEGTVFVDLVDPRASKLVWRGWVVASVDGVIDDQAVMEKRIDQAVVQILQELPRRL